MGSVFHQTLPFYMKGQAAPGISYPVCALWLCRDLDMKWKFGQVKSKDPPATLPTYKSDSLGTVPRTKEYKTPLQILQLFLTGAILDSIVKQTKQMQSCKNSINE